MKAEYWVNKRFKIELDGEDAMTLFDKIADINRVFEDSKCGVCKSENITPAVRVVDDNTFHELKCLDCGCRCTYGKQKKSGAYYIRRNEIESVDDKKRGVTKGMAKKDKDGKVVTLPNNGWGKYTAPIEE